MFCPIDGMQLRRNDYWFVIKDACYFWHSVIVLLTLYDLSEISICGIYFGESS